MTYVALFLGFISGLIVAILAGCFKAAYQDMRREFSFLKQATEAPTPEQRRRWLKAEYPGALSALNPLSGRRRGEPLPVHHLPKGVEAHPVGDEVVLTDTRGNTLLVGENDRGGYGFKTPREMHWHGNYATLTDAVRAAARDGFKQQNS